MFEEGDRIAGAGHLAVAHRTLADDLDEAETLLVDGVLHRLHELEHVVGRPARNVAPTSRGHHICDLERVFQVEIRRRRGACTEGSRGRYLSAGHTVDEVVDQKDRQVEVAARRVDQVVATDSGEIPVAGDDDHLHVWPHHLDAAGEGDRPAVGGV